MSVLSLPTWSVWITENAPKSAATPMSARTGTMAPIFGIVKLRFA